MLKAVYGSRPGDEEKIRFYLNRFAKETDKELVADYNKQAKLGFVGVHQQMLFMLAVHYEFIKRFGESPVVVEDHGGIKILDTKGEIVIEDGRIRYLENKAD